MGDLRSVTLVFAGVSLLASCGTQPPDPSPTASPTASRQSWHPSPSRTASPVSSAWKIVRPAELVGSSALLDVAAAGPREVWAVGYQRGAEDSEGSPAVVRWDGTRWREVAGLTGRDVNHLTGVSVAGPGDVWVAGNGVNAFAARWDGRRWTARRPFGVAEDYRLTDVAATGGTAWFTGNGPSGGVLIRWDGTAFQNVLTGSGGTFEAVTARQGHVWAVGAAKDGTPLVWHGSPDRWERLPTPAIPGGTLRRVWQVSPSDVWAVGEVAPADAVRDGARIRRGRPLVLHWDGTRWARAEVPVARGALQGVTASGPGDLWISGIDADQPGRALLLRFDGTTWTREYGPLLRMPRPDQQYEDSDRVTRTGVTRVPGTDTLWAVGSVGVGDDEDDFVLRR
ncbi:hypothetical protein ACFY19_34865 [Streptosporangium saharense]|uniref:hypothetical protein n=1 Tax=Streptosporangium saharense TaxID=1706840 RepID=UPI0036BDE224